ncbi:hypothetical protein EPO15_06005 [bacterium]|nr:MAG: hypothetical protein EPO15_06005 [bacterium]
MGKKKAEEAVDGVKPMSLDQMVLDKKEGKYRVVELVSFWAKSLRAKEEHRHLTQNEVLELALTQVLSGEVSEKEVEKLKAAAPPTHVASEEEKPRRKLSL